MMDAALRVVLAAKMAARTRKGDGCWEYAGSCSSTGYGQLVANRRNFAAHRVAWAMANGGWPPPGLLVMHTCDNRRCVRPDHLRLGTYRDNARDMVSKGRHPDYREERSHSRKLTRDEVVEIRRLYAAGGQSGAKLGRRFGVCRQQILRIVHGTRWTESARLAGIEAASR